MEEEPKKRAKWRDGDKWNKIIGIPFADCVNACGQMEKAIIFPKASDKPSKDQNCLAFGKYKGQTKEWVMKNDPGYWRWMTENVKGFK